MVIKLCGVIMLLFGGVWFGLSAKRTLGMRVRTLRSLIECLELIEWELTTNMPPMEHLLCEIAGQASAPAARFFSDCAKGLDRNDQTMAEIWRAAAEETLKPLKAEDLEVLLPVGAVLGRYDVDSQINSVKAARDRLANNLMDSINEKRRLGRLYSTLGAAAGLFFAIVLL